MFLVTCFMIMNVNRLKDIHRNLFCPSILKSSKEAVFELSIINLSFLKIMEGVMMHLISDKLVDLVANHSDDIVKRWVVRLLSDPATQSFTEKHMPYVEEKAKEVLAKLGKWVSYDTKKEEVGKRYAEEGGNFFKMEVPLCEAIRATYVLRRTLWLFVENESAFDSAFQLHQMRELNDRVILFFDRAEFYMIRGYTEEMNRKIKELWDVSADETEKIFFNRSFYRQ